MDNAVRMYIHQFGPISDAEFTIRKFTIFTGRQGSGKSTVAKLYSLFTWMEKNLLRNTISIKYITQYSRFRNIYCEYNRLDSYFKDDTEIRYTGMHYTFHYVDGKLNIEEMNHNNEYNVAKVMYVPAERNFLSSIDNASGIRNMPKSLQTFLEEFDNARNNLKNGYQLPINNVSLEYDALNKISWLRGQDYRIRLSAASSGYQSVIPLTLVTAYLSDLVNKNANKDNLSISEKNQIRKEVEKIMADKTLTEEVKYAMLSNISSRFKYSAFVNIVEEMEQNLYPESQMMILFDLIKHANRLQDNRLVLTTHSPYIINYITLATKAYNLRCKISDNRELANRINNIVPEESLVNPELLNIYEMKDGKRTLLTMYDGIPSDENFLNAQLGFTNELFDRLIEIEEDFDNKS